MICLDFHILILPPFNSSKLSEYNWNFNKFENSISSIKIPFTPFYIQKRFIYHTLIQYITPKREYKVITCIIALNKNV